MKTLPAKCRCAGVPLFYCLDCGSPGLKARRVAADLIRYPLDPPGYAERVRELEAEGLTTSDAQGVADAEFREPRPTTTCAHCGQDFHDRSLIPLDGGGELCHDCMDALRDAAPELLAACDMVQRAYAGDGVDMARAVDACLLAIAKAIQGEGTHE